MAQGVPLFFLQVASSSCSSRYWGVWWSACIAAGGVPADVHLPATSPRPPPPKPTSLLAETRELAPGMPDPGWRWHQQRPGHSGHQAAGQVTQRVTLGSFLLHVLRELQRRVGAMPLPARARRRGICGVCSHTAAAARAGRPGPGPCHQSVTPPTYAVAAAAQAVGVLLTVARGPQDAFTLVA